jgi:hypothetical protein
MIPTEEALRDDREAATRAEYERLHPDDSFDDLQRRARFSKEDQGLLREWLRSSGAATFRRATPRV